MPPITVPSFFVIESIVISAHAGWWEDPSWEICLSDILMTLGTRVKISCNNTGHFQSVVALHMQHCRIQFLLFGKGCRHWGWELGVTWKVGVGITQRGSLGQCTERELSSGLDKAILQRRDTAVLVQVNHWSFLAGGCPTTVHQVLAQHSRTLWPVQQASGASATPATYLPSHRRTFKRCGLVEDD